MNKLLSICLLSSIPFFPTYESHIEINTVLDDKNEVRFTQVLFRGEDDFIDDYKMLKQGGIIGIILIFRHGHLYWTEDGYQYIVKVKSFKYTTTHVDMEMKQRQHESQNPFRHRIKLKDFYER